MDWTEKQKAAIKEYSDVQYRILKDGWEGGELVNLSNKPIGVIPIEKNLKVDKQHIENGS